VGWDRSGACQTRAHQARCPHKALRTRPRRRPRPRIWPRGVMEYWSVGVLRQVRIAPRVRGVGRPFSVISYGLNPGLKPWAILFSHFVATGVVATH
jgi:hypothetical protein